MSKRSSHRFRFKRGQRVDVVVEGDLIGPGTVTKAEKIETDPGHFRDGYIVRLDSTDGLTRHVLGNLGLKSATKTLTLCEFELKERE